MAVYIFTLTCSRVSGVTTSSQVLGLRPRRAGLPQYPISHAFHANKSTDFIVILSVSEDLSGSNRETRLNSVCSS